MLDSFEEQIFDYSHEGDVFDPDEDDMLDALKTVGWVTKITTAEELENILVSWEKQPVGRGEDVDEWIAAIENLEGVKIDTSKLKNLTPEQFIDYIKQVLAKMKEQEVRADAPGQRRFVFANKQRNVMNMIWERVND